MILLWNIYISAFIITGRLWYPALKMESLNVHSENTWNNPSKVSCINSIAEAIGLILQVDKTRMAELQT